MSLTIDVAQYLAAGLLAAAGLLVVVRMTLGPTMLDRALAFDVLVAVAVCVIGLDAAARRTTDNLPLMLVASIVGFVGSISIARFSPGSDEVEVDDDDPADDALSESGDGQDGGTR